MCCTLPDLFNFIACLYTSPIPGISFANHYPSGIILRMITMIEERYDALKEADASEEKAIAAAKSIADYENHFVRMESKSDSLEAEIKLVKIDIRRIKWLLVFFNAGTISLIIKAFI